MCSSDLYKDGVFVFLLPPDMNELRNRIEKRATEDKDTIELRLNNAKTELNYIDKYDYAVINDTVSNTVEKIKSIIEAERHRVMK